MSTLLPVLLAAAALAAPAADAAPERVEFTLREMRIAVKGAGRGRPLTLKAGRPYALHFANRGQLQHELAFGRGRKAGAGGAGFAEGLLAGVRAELVFRDSEGREASAFAAGFEEVELAPGASATLLLTLPESAAGDWELACFMPGHEGAGMRLPLRVSPAGVSAAR